MRWVRALAWAAPAALAILGLFYYWFAVADRYAVFLYGHSASGTAGPAQPFDAVTSSRYWMAGLVACGAVMLGYAALNWALGRVADWRGRKYRPPAWWRVWALCVPALVVGIPAVTMTVNAPTLPPLLAAACVGVTLGGPAFALLPGDWAAQRPMDLAWLALGGAGLVPPLLLLRAVELPGRGLSVSAPLAHAVALGGVLVGAAWLGAMTALRRWRGRPAPGAGALLAAGLGLSYLAMPLAHYLFATPAAYRYITAASNLFAFSPALQLLALAVAVALAVGVSRLRGARQSATGPHAARQPGADPYRGGPASRAGS